jgi:hypothetical protein
MKKVFYRVGDCCKGICSRIIRDNIKKDDYQIVERNVFRMTWTNMWNILAGYDNVPTPSLLNSAYNILETI